MIKEDRFIVQGAIGLATGEFDANIHTGPWREFAEGYYTTEYRDQYYSLIKDVVGLCENGRKNEKELKSEIIDIAENHAEQLSRTIREIGRYQLIEETRIDEEEIPSDPTYEELMDIWEKYKS